MSGKLGKELLFEGLMTLRKMMKSCRGFGDGFKVEEDDAVVEELDVFA